MVAIPSALLLAAGHVPLPPAIPAEDARRLIVMTPGVTTCEGGAVRPVRLEPPDSHIAYWSASQLSAPLRVTFAIDATGRPIDVDAAAGRLPVDTSDVVPSLVVSRYAAGQPHLRCAITYTPIAWPLRDAPVDALYRYYSLPHERLYNEAPVFDAFRPAGATCYTPHWPAPRLLAFPAFEDIPLPLGTRAYAMIGFDIDRNGKPRNVHVVSRGGDPVFDKASMAAIARSRYQPGAQMRTGCLYPYRLTPPMPLPAPALPAKDSGYDRTADTCADLPKDYVRAPDLVYPEPFRKRPIEGWAIVRFDVAPWGAIGNVRVEKAEPAAAFGEQAKRVMEAATKPASPRGYSDCVERVLFKMPADR